MSSLYNFSYQTPNGEVHSFEEHKGKAVLIVNTATQCGLTPQFKGLQELHERYADKGLVVLGFPCNQFMRQEPLNDAEMEQACENNHGVTFQLTKKIEVNGKNADPLYKYLKKQKGGFIFSRIKWNFEKFLIDSNGSAVKRFAPNVKPKDLEKDIK
ncbi:MAG: glutathione peroxidase, partial [Crocinitomicaceae bacterium]|nr:glutathione peroxidase [Crocinitomicaceae bacterium]